MSIPNRRKAPNLLRTVNTGAANSMSLPSHVQILIVGGGIAGASVAYHLAKLGRTDTVLLERNQLTSGTTWHAAGLIMQLRSTHSLTELARYNVELYAKLEAETGQATGFKQNGTLGVCRTRDRLFETRRVASIAKSFDIEAHMITPAEAKALYPALNERIIEGAIYIPKDGQTNPVDSTMSLIAGARQRGVEIVENCPVTKLERLASGERKQVGCVKGRRTTTTGNEIWPLSELELEHIGAIQINATRQRQCGHTRRVCTSRCSKDVCRYWGGDKAI